MLIRQSADYVSPSLVFDVAMDVSRIVSCSHDQKITMYDFGEEIGAERFM
jgi:hypothetical protein